MQLFFQDNMPVVVITHPDRLVKDKESGEQCL